LTFCSKAPGGLAKSNRPANEWQTGERLGHGSDFELAWGSFYISFDRYKTASFFAELPPTNLSPGY
jgi:hypothetical protein